MAYTPPPTATSAVIFTPIPKNPQSPPPSPFVFEIPKSNMKPVFFPILNRMVIIASVPTYDSQVQFSMDQNRKMIIYDLEKGIALYELETESQIRSLYATDDTLYMDAGILQAFNISLFISLELKYSRNISSGVCFGENFAVYQTRAREIEGKDQQKMLEICIADPKNLEPKKFIRADYWYQTFIHNDDLYILGTECATSYEDVHPWSGYLMKYEKPHISDESPFKVNFDNQHIKCADSSLNVNDGAVYIYSWQSYNNIIWDSQSLDCLYEKKTENLVVINTIINEDRCVSWNSQSMEFLKKKDGLFTLVKQIEFEKNDPATFLDFFSKDLLIEGYLTGVIRFRNVNDYKISKDLRSPEGMTYVLSTRVVNNKLIAHYKNASQQGNLFVIWDLQTDQPLLIMGSDAIKNRNYKSEFDDYLVINNDVIVRIENQVIVYKGALA